jgi:hypothetical protein
VTLTLGCGSTAGDSAGSGTASGAQSPATDSASDIDPCSLVTRTEAEKALGGSVGEGERPAAANIPPRLATCRYVAQRGEGLAVMTVMVRRGDTESESRIGFEQAREQFPGAEAIGDLGANAFWFGNQLNVLQGRVYLNITGDVDRATATQLASAALQRL